MNEFEKIMVVAILVGWAFNLGILWQMSRNHKEQIDENSEHIKLLQERVDQHHEMAAIHTSEEWRHELRAQLNGIKLKVDAIQAQCLQRITKGQC